VMGVPLAAGVPVRSGSSTYYLARSMEIALPGRSCDTLSPIQYLEVIDARP
jgi:hypothetical protein